MDGSDGFDGLVAGDELEVLGRLLHLDVLCSIDLITWEYHDYLFKERKEPEKMYLSENRSRTWDFIFAHQAVGDEDAKYQAPLFTRLREIWQRRVKLHEASAKRKLGCRTRFVAKDDEEYHRRRRR